MSIRRRPYAKRHPFELIGVDTVSRRSLARHRWSLRAGGVEGGPYWSVDVPGLTEGEAKQLVAWVTARQLGWFGSATAVDPATFLTLHLDRESARTLLDGLMSQPHTAGAEHGLAEHLAEWLSEPPSSD